MDGVSSVPVDDLGRLPTHAVSSCQTGVFDHAARFTLPRLPSLNLLARPNVTPRSWIIMNGLGPAIGPLAVWSDLGSSRQSKRCCSGLVSVCWMKTARSLKASRSARVAPPDFSSIRSSSFHDQPSSGRYASPGILRSTAAGSNTLSLGLRITPLKRDGQSRHTTRTEYM